MADLKLGWVGDLSVSPTGDLLTIDNPDLGTERILRRLLTNVNDYIWNPTYGAGLGQFIGKPNQISEIEALMRSQLKLEQSVSQVPDPVITIEAVNYGEVCAQIRYVDSVTGLSSITTVKVVN